MLGAGPYAAIDASYVPVGADKIVWEKGGWAAAGFAGAQFLFYLQWGFLRKLQGR